MSDRVRDGRRYIMVGTLLARGLLCWGMAGAVQHSDTVTLLPAAFGVLVLQKAYGVTRSAVTPRVLPASITLVSANARISLAALVASTLGVGVAGGVSFLAGGGTAGATWALRIGTLVYLGAIALGIRLPTTVDQQDPQAATPAAEAAAGGPGPAAPGQPAQAQPARAPPPPAPHQGPPSRSRALREPVPRGRPGPRPPQAPPDPGRPERLRGAPGGPPPCAAWARSWVRRCAATRRCGPSPAT